MQTVKLLRAEVDKIDNIKGQKRFSPEYEAWKRKTASILERHFGKNSRQLEDFESISYAGQVFIVGQSDSISQNHYLEGLDNARAILESIIEEVIEYSEDDATVLNDLEVSATSLLTQIFSSFPRVARQLRSRHAERETLKIQDEYDVQDLLHALLKLHFTDVRAEEVTPSYGGKHARTDFLLKNEKIVIEVKMASEKLGEKEISDQLIIDTARYQTHPDSKQLVCFIYDPLQVIGNPQGLISDLSGRKDSMLVDVFISPE